MFTDIYIRRPVFASTLSMIILLVGIVAYFNLPVREFPKIDASVVTVSITYPGANAELMEGFVTTPVENALTSVDGIDYISSSSTQSKTQITIYMKMGYDIDKALSEVSTKVQSVRWKLPKDINDPVIDKQDPNASPLLYLSFSSKKMSPEEVTDYLLRVVQPQIQTLSGVSQAQIYGSREYAMRIWLNPELMAAKNITAHEVNSSILGNSVLSAAGRIDGKVQEFDIYSNTDLQTPFGFNRLFLRNKNGHIIQIRDIGTAKLGPVDDRVSVIMDGENTRVIGVIPKSTANPLDVADNVKTFLPTIEKYLPQDLKVYILWDSSQFITNSIREVKHTFIEACIFVFLVIFFMIGSLRSVFVPIITIPLSIIGTCFIMLGLRFSINTLTLLAFVLAIGLVVDDAIVVLENIRRHLSRGLTPFNAAIVGAREIAFAVITMTLTLAAVYTPIGFMEGLTGKLFSEFAFTLASAVLVSGFLALTLSPMMCSRIFKANEKLNAGFPGLIEKIFHRINNGYKTILDKTLRLWVIIVLIAGAILVACTFLYLHTPAELIPTEDQGVLFVSAHGSAAANLHYTESQTQIFEKIYHAIPEMVHYGIINGTPDVNSAISFIVFKPWNERKRTTMQIMREIIGPIWAIPGIIAFPGMPPLLPGASGYTPISFVLKTTDTYTHLLQATQKFIDALNHWGKIVNIYCDLKIDKPQIFVDVNRNLTDDLGILSGDIADSLSAAYGQPITAWFNMAGRSYQIIPQIQDSFRDMPDSIRALRARSQSGDLVPFSNFAQIKEQIVPRSLNHFQQLRDAMITANLGPGITQGQALDYMTALAAKILPNTVQVDYADQARQYIEAKGKMLQTFLFAIIFIYLILAAQFESFRDPFIVMFSVPLSIAGALLFLKLGNGTLNIYTQIGLITLVGLITKNGILIVEFANQQQERGVEFREAILTGASMRLRPILMTTLAMLLGALPLALATGAGAESRQQMGLIILGGMSLGTLLTLFVVPVAYYLFASKKEPDPNANFEKEIEAFNSHQEE